MCGPGFFDVSDIRSLYILKLFKLELLEDLIVRKNILGATGQR